MIHFYQKVFWKFTAPNPIFPIFINIQINTEGLPIVSDDFPPSPQFFLNDFDNIAYTDVKCEEPIWLDF